MLTGKALFYTKFHNHPLPFRPQAALILKPYKQIFFKWQGLIKDIFLASEDKQLRLEIISMAKFLER